MTSGSCPVTATRRQYALTLLLLLAAIAGGLLARQALQAPWLRNAVGAMLFVVAGALFLQLLAPRARPVVLAAIAFVGTCAIEFLQLSHARWLVAIRDTRIGRLLLGANGGYDPMDLALYAVGAVLGGALCQGIQRAAAAR